jgi:hypothetical protein
MNFDKSPDKLKDIEIGKVENQVHQHESAAHQKLNLLNSQYKLRIERLNNRLLIPQAIMAANESP